jgi:hypothetical protein
MTLVESLQSTNFYGQVQLEMHSGNIVLVRLTQSMKLGDRDGKAQSYTEAKVY